MKFDQNELTSVVHRCIDLISKLKSSSRNLAKSETTRNEYLRLAQNLLETSQRSKVTLGEVVRNTTRSSTFHKRIAALQFYVFKQMGSLATELPQATNQLVCERLISEFLVLSSQLTDLVQTKQEGLSTLRSPRCSKRRALSKLPKDWRVLICDGGAKGKYSIPLLVCSLTGARPQELKNGITAKAITCEDSAQELIQFSIQGVKVGANQGQTNRAIYYAIDDENPAVKKFVAHFRAMGSSQLLVQIESAVNFTVEVRRLAKQLWPSHKHSVTAYCFRHQFAADLKSIGDTDAVSKGLGHLSTKTSRNYGTARQSNQGEQLRPWKIEATCPIKHFAKSFGETPNVFANSPD